MTDLQNTDPWVRMLQIFSAKIVLEVFGAAGAVWGFSEVCTLRNPSTQEYWRHNALTVGVIFFIRYLLQMRDFAANIRGETSPRKDGSLLRLVQIFSAKMVLEVWGGGGAIWGFSEVLTLRNHETQELWRYNASVMAIIFLVRYLLQIRDYVNQHGMLEGDDFSLRGLQIFSAKLVLEVFGGAGAIWGFSEVLTLRRPETQELWRFNALAIGFIFFLRYLCQIKDYAQKVDYASLNHNKTIRGLQIFSAKIVLEVLGGGGAVWGFSEVLTLRNHETQELWRTNARVAGAVFFVRYLLQLKDYINDASVRALSKETSDIEEQVRLTATY